jgi:A/G-specific adenine glycosylase
MEKAFTSILLHWHEHENHRAMPWKGEKDPYKIWLSEIILQQTRVEQGWAYYEKYIKAFPTVRDLAAAPDETVLKMWEGLGYYSRCRNLLYTARMIVNEFDGHFPSDYKELLRLKGVGAYTAAAIASFAFNLPYAVVDGNVIRVLSRYFGITEPTDLALVKKQLDALAQRLIDSHKPAAYNQAIMDFPKKLLCKIERLCARATR